MIASHGGPEAETIRAALDAGVGYIGLVASRVRGASIAGRRSTSTDAERARVHTPVGLPIGAKTPAEIAVSIVAEVVRNPSADCRRPDGRRDNRGGPVCGMTMVGPITDSRTTVDHWFCCPPKFERPGTSVDDVIASTAVPARRPRRRSIWPSRSAGRCCWKANPASARRRRRKPLPPCWIHRWSGCSAMRV